MLGCPVGWGTQESPGGWAGSYPGRPEGRAGRTGAGVVIKVQLVVLCLPLDRWGDG